MSRISLAVLAVCVVHGLGPFPGVEAAAQSERPFPLMGFTPVAYDTSLDAGERALIEDVVYAAIDEHANIIAHHFDEGVPWQEAYEGRPYHPNVEANIASRLEHTQPNQQVYLALTPLFQDRRSLAKNWGETPHEPRTGAWADRDFGDPEVFQAYYNFCRDMILRFDPDYFAYAIEANLWAKETDPDRFSRFWEFTGRIYRDLKAEFPDLPIFLTVAVSSTEDFVHLRPFTEAVLLNSDFVAVSSYPYFDPWIEGDPAKLPLDWFARIRSLAPGKPYAVAETGYTAESLVVPLEQEPWQWPIAGTPEWQAQYVQFLLNDAATAGAQFVIWFVPIDYDGLWSKIKDEAPPFYVVWKDNGLIDEALQGRPGLFVWDFWLSYSRLLNGF